MMQNVTKNESIALAVATMTQFVRANTNTTLWDWGQVVTDAEIQTRVAAVEAVCEICAVGSFGRTRGRNGKRTLFRPASAAW